MHYFRVNYFVSQLTNTCVDTCSLPSPIVPFLQWKEFLLSQRIARPLFEEREVIWGLDAGGLKQLIELKVTARSQPKTYLKPHSLCLQTPLVGAVPHKHQISSSIIISLSVQAQTQIDLPSSRQKRALLVPLHLFPSPGMLVLLETQAGISLQMPF